MDEIAFLMQISPSLVHVYQDVYECYSQPPYQERIDEIIDQVKSRHFRPSRLEPLAVEKGGTHS